MSRVRVFIACSLDGFIAGANDDIEWLNPEQPAGDDAERTEDTFTPFLTEVGAMLMGRRTFDVVAGFEGDWPYGDLPILVATKRPLESARSSVQAIGGSIESMVETAKATAGQRDVYLDGGSLIRSALDEALIDEMTITVIPIILGQGLPLFAGVSQRHTLEFLGGRSIGRGLMELRYRPRQRSG
jgi:dihydrofolate reductase